MGQIFVWFPAKIIWCTRDNAYCIHYSLIFRTFIFIYWSVIRKLGPPKISNYMVYTCTKTGNGGTAAWRTGDEKAIARGGREQENGEFSFWRVRDCFSPNLSPPALLSLDTWWGKWTPCLTVYLGTAVQTKGSNLWLVLCVWFINFPFLHAPLSLMRGTSPYYSVCVCVCVWGANIIFRG